ncbi:MAG: hypothetical protein A2V70_04280 [Planctomycetes bacterium RBG_13_63_9]|nr:MAG: hypothetical protein A2V70_04280 [Planctomycetes bacterium RBG_13_63_9]
MGKRKAFKPAEAPCNSLAWKALLSDAVAWRCLTEDYCDHPEDSDCHLGRDFVALTGQLVRACEAEGIDGTPFAAVRDRIVAHQYPAVHPMAPPLDRVIAAVNDARRLIERLFILATVPDTTPDNGSERANTARLFSGPIPDNPDVVDLVCRLDAEQAKPEAERRQKVDIARELVGNDEQKAKSLLAQIRRLRKAGRVNL